MDRGGCDPYRDQCKRTPYSGDPKKAGSEDLKLTKRVLMTYLNTVERPAEGTPYLKQILKICNAQQC